MHKFYGIFLAIFGIIFATTLHAQKYPSKPIRWIIPNAPGGTNSVIAGALAPPLSEILGTQVITDYRAGAAGTIATNLAAKATPDGYTLLLGIASPLAIVQKRPYDSVKDFAPITKITKSESILYTASSSPYQKIKEVIDYAKSNPGKLTYSHSGSGSFNHVAGEMFRFAAGIEMVSVPYKGAGPALLGVMTKEVDFGMSNIAGAMAHIQANRIRGLAVTAKKRVSVLPQIPTMDESGLSGFEAELWYAFLAPAGTPKPIIETLHKAMLYTLKSPEIVQRFAAVGMLPEGSTPIELSKYIVSEIEKWQPILNKIQ
ncbi:MAG: tripartite tricarboxylate transporter substrate binding protein [Burkholderiales bacterium]|nr:tripartite tricarboxylate transporter substrate binding protein [Burkholderiales bacterium]